MLHRWCGLLLAMLVLAGCVGAPAAAVSSPTATAPAASATRGPATSVAAAPTKVVVSVVVAAPSVTAVAGSGVQGSVVLAEGRCCVGGKAGTTVQIGGAFAATSDGGRVTELRVRGGPGGCLSAEALAQAPWEPFVASKTFAFENIPINWVGYYVSAQFRDEGGRVSAVACDDISVEGMP